MGKITQLMYGVISPGNMTANLMTANVTGGCASHSADLLTDLKSGYLLGANPRKQFLAQLLGVFAGSLFAVPAYRLLVTPETLGSEALPAPAARIWAAVAEAFKNGLDALHPTAVTAIMVGLAVGALIPTLERFLPASRKFLPSPTGLGIAFVISGYNSVSMFIGAVIAWYLARKHPHLDEAYTVPVSSGLIAGESLMGVFIAGLVAFGYL
jgi:putative OPT family oligopeptide transporter